jgi:hypothetical protein
MRGWHSAGKITQSGPLKFWDPAEIGARVKEELAKGITKKENLGQVMAGAV